MKRLAVWPSGHPAAADGFGDFPTECRVECAGVYAGEAAVPRVYRSRLCGMARFIASHPDPWGWNPLPYAGLPVQFMYVPVLPYLAALGMRLLPDVSPDSVYRTMVTFAHLPGPGDCSWFALLLHGKPAMGVRQGAWRTACFRLLYGLFPAVEKDRGIVQLRGGPTGCSPSMARARITRISRFMPLRYWRSRKAAKGRGYRGFWGQPWLLAAIPLTNCGGALLPGHLVRAPASGGMGRAWVPCLARAGGCGAGVPPGLFLAHPRFREDHRVQLAGGFVAYRVAWNAGVVAGGTAVGCPLIRLLFRFRGARISLSISASLPWVHSFWAGSPRLFTSTASILIPRIAPLRHRIRAVLGAGPGGGFPARHAQFGRHRRLCAIGTGAVMLLVGGAATVGINDPGWRAVVAHASRGDGGIPGGPMDRPASSARTRLRLGRPAISTRFLVRYSAGRRRVRNGTANFGGAGGPHVPCPRGRDSLAGRWRCLLQLKALGAEYVVVHGPESREYYRDFVRPERVAGCPAGGLHGRKTTRPSIVCHPGPLPVPW